MSKAIPVFCVACERGDHYYCGMQLWCECQDGEDGGASPQEREAYVDRVDPPADDDDEIPED